jgi:hypothetical protein
VDGDRARTALIELINLEDTAQYGLIPITQRELTTTLRRAKTITCRLTGLRWPRSK